MYSLSTIFSTVMLFRIVYQFLSAFSRCFHRIVAFPPFPVLKLYFLRRERGVTSTGLLVILTRLLVRLLITRRMLEKQIL